MIIVFGFASIAYLKKVFKELISFSEIFLYLSIFLN